MTDPIDPEDTRPEIPEPALRRRRSSQSVRAVVCVRCTELQRRLASLRIERDRDARLLREAEGRATIATLRAESAEHQLRALRGARDA